jgi:hypothetical protein
MTTSKDTRRALLGLTLTLAAGLLAAEPAMAQKKPGGGGGGETTPVPAGTIHFSQSTADSWYYADMTMKADGSAKTQLGIHEQGQAWKPSYQLHGGQRWFLNLQETGEMNEYGWMIQQLFASTAAGNLVQLTDDPDLLIYSVRWSKDDSFLSFVGYSYDPTTDEEEEDLYVADIDWSSGGPEIGLPRKVLSTLYCIDDLKQSFFGAYDWSPAGDELVYNDSSDWDRREIRVATFLENGSVETRHLGHGLYPTWSADGNWIAYGESGIWKIRRGAALHSCVWPAAHRPGLVARQSASGVHAKHTEIDHKERCHHNDLYLRHPSRFCRRRDGHESDHRHRRPLLVDRLAVNTALASHLGVACGDPPASLEVSDVCCPPRRSRENQCELETLAAH